MATTGRSQTIACLVLVGFLLVVLLVTPPATAPPPIPMRTQGSAFDRSGSPLPLGTPIRTFVDGVNYTEGRFPGDPMEVQDGIGSFAVLTVGNSKTNANLSDTPTVQEGANLGDPVIYAAGDFTTTADVFEEVISWTPGSVRATDLNLGSLASTPKPLKIQGVVLRPAQGGNQFALLCNPTTAPVSLADYYLERDGPGTYHGGTIGLTGVLGPAPAFARFNLSSGSWLTPSGDALKLVYQNPRGAGASAGGLDIVVDRVEFNRTQGGTLTWEPGNTIMGDAPAPGAGRILQRDSSCTDTNAPSDFTIGMEPGLPANGPPTVAIGVPASGQEFQAATTVTFSWTMSDDVFLEAYLHVWANVTIGNQTIPIVTDQEGVMSVSWTTPDVTASNVIFRVDVEDPFGAHASDTRTIRLTRQSPIALIVAVLIAVVLIAFLIFGFWRARKREQAPLPGPPSPPKAPPVPLIMAPPVGAGQIPGDKKVCPRCHTMVDAADVTCFFCGFRFSESNPPTP